MTRATSFFLDVLRFGAALLVFLSHVSDYLGFPLLKSLQSWAHDAVIVFFVLSGYVIAYTARAKGGDARDYVAARLSRLYSVVVPALVLTAVLWLVGREIDSGVYAGEERAHPALRFAASAVFMHQVWFLQISPPSNTPFWSLGYEAWYYVFFGLALFVKSRAWKWTALIVGGLIVGPAVLMLMPVFLLGVAAFVWRDRGGLSRPMALAGLAVSTLFTAAVLKYLPDLPATHGAAPWFFAGAAISDFIGGVGWAAVIWFFNRAFIGTDLPDKLYRPVRWVAGHTFSLYLYHAPLVFFAAALFPPVLMDGKEWVVVLGMLAVILGLGAITEAQRGRWQRFFVWLLDRLLPARIGARSTPAS